MFTCFAVAAPGTELWVADEIRDLGFQDIVEIEGGVEFEASLKDVMRANLWSRTVSRFLVRLATFPGARAIAFTEANHQAGTHIICTQGCCSSAQGHV